MRNITIKEIAELAGVSTSAVSLVLNGKKGVGEETRSKILEIIDELNYTPNMNSRRLILKRSFNVFVVMDESITSLDNYFYTAILKTIVSKASELGYNTVISLTSSQFNGSSLSNALKQGNVDGIIFLQDISSELQYNIEKFNIPLVIVDSQRVNPPYPCVRGDYELSSYVATKHFIENGHRKIGFIGMGAIPDFYLRCFNGYKRALSENKLLCSLDWIQSDAHDEESARMCMERIIDSNDLPTAVFCAGDAFAIGAMNCVREKGFDVPDDFSFAAIDDILISKYYYPALTTIRIDEGEMGFNAIQMLDSLINKKEIDLVYTIKSDNLIIRKSVKKIK